MQSGLWAIREALLAEGILYPESLRGHFAQHRLGFALAGKRDPFRGDEPRVAEVLADLMAEVEATAPRVLLISSEVLSLARPERIAALAQSLRDRPVTVAAALRHPVEAFLSNYDQVVKDPDKTFAKAPAEILGSCARTFRTLDVEAILERWGTAMPEAELHVMAYRPGAMQDDILALAGAATPFPPGGTLANAGTDGRALEVIRLAKLKGLGPAEVRRVADEAGRRLTGAGPIHVPPDVLQALHAELCPLYDRLYPRHLGRPNPFRAEDWAAFLPRLAPPVVPEMAERLIADALRQG